MIDRRASTIDDRSSASIDHRSSMIDDRVSADDQSPMIDDPSSVIDHRSLNHLKTQGHPWELPLGGHVVSTTSLRLRLGLLGSLGGPNDL